VGCTGDSDIFGLVGVQRCRERGDGDIIVRKTKEGAKQANISRSGTAVSLSVHIDLAASPGLYVVPSSIC